MWIIIIALKKNKAGMSVKWESCCGGVEYGFRLLRVQTEGLSEKMRFERNIKRQSES